MAKTLGQVVRSVNGKAPLALRMNRSMPAG